MVYFSFHVLKNRRDSIVKSARKEIEIARDEKDPLLIMRMILTSREAMRKLSDKVIIIKLRHLHR